MSDDCPECPGSRNSGYRFCIGCGRDLSRRASSPVLMFGLAITAICVLILGVEVFTAFYKSGYVFSNLYSYSNGFLILTPYPTTMFTITGIPLQIYYVILLIVMTVSVAWTVYMFIGPLRSYAANGDEGPIKNTALFESATLFAALYVIELAFTMFLLLSGVDIGPGVSGDDWELMFLLLDASVWEEVVSRILLIGVPMMAIVLILRYRNSDTVDDIADEETPWWRYLLGGFGMSRIAVVFIVFSALIFGIAHIPGWGLWKAFPTFLFGLIAGYLFVKYGVHVTIMIHFLTDYLSSFGWLAPNGNTFMVLFLLAIALFGLVYVWVYVKRCASYLKNEFIDGEDAS